MVAFFFSGLRYNRKRAMPAVHRFAAVVFLTVLVAVAYGGSLRNELVFDDMIFMQHDPRLRSLDQATRLFVEPLWGFTDDDGRAHAHQYYRPLQTLPLAWSRTFFGEAAWPSHALNVLVHWLNCLMVFALICRVTEGSRVQGVEGSSADTVNPMIDLNPRTLEPSIPAAADSNPRTLEPSIPALAAAALFAVHPGYSEAVLWVSNIAGLGVAACTLAILLLHMSTRASRWSTQLVVAILFLAGLWFKEAGILVPVLMALYDLLLAPDRGWRRLLRSWRRYLVLLPPFALYYALRLRALGGALPGFNVVPLTPWELVINAIALLPQYVATFVWPVDLNMYYDFDAIHSVSSWRFAGGLTLLVLGMSTIAACRRRHPPVSFGIAWSFIAVSPHLLARWPQLNVFAERYLYLPAVGVFVVAAYAVLQMPLFRYRRALAWATAVLLAVGPFIDARRTGDWHDEVTLYTKTLTQSRRAELIRINLGLKLYELGRYDEGIAVLQDLVAFDPSWHDAWHNLGLLYMGKQADAAALVAFERACSVDAANPETLLNLGFLYDRQGRRDDALAAYFRALRVQPNNAKVWYNLASIAVELGQLDNARAALDNVLRVAPQDDDARALQRRLATFAAGAAPPPRVRSAETERRCAAAKQAVDAGRDDEAIVGLLVASWYDETSPLPHQYLANVFYLVGRIDEALRHQRLALARAPDNELYRRNLASLENAAGERGGPGR